MVHDFINVNKENIPKHVAIIMDGNGRWANERGLPRSMGHREGVKTLRKILEIADNIGIKYLTVYAFSTENWKRPQNEIDTLMNLFQEYLKKEKKELNKRNVRLCFSGRRDKISQNLLDEMDKTQEYLSKNTGIILNIAFNYGGRAEIIDAVNKIVEEGKKIDEENFRKYLYNPDIPDPELLIRTSGEIRISNFLLWQIAYTEIYITKKYWPDFEKEDFIKAINDYLKRNRRFGGVKNGK